MNGITRLPDGSAFFVGTVGPREGGFVNWLKYRKVGCARKYLFLYRMFESGRSEFRMSFIDSIKAAWICR